MIACLRVIGILNAAAWLGTALFVLFSVGAVTSSDDMRALLQPASFPYFSRAIECLLVTRCLYWELACIFVALGHLLLEGLYFGRGLRWFRLGLLLGLFWIVLGGLWVQPKLRDLNVVEFGTGASAQRREQARQSARIWQGVASTLQGLTAVGAAVYLWRVGHPPAATRFVPEVKFRS